MTARRDVLRGLAAVCAFATPHTFANASRSAKIIIIGGGFGGATAAMTLKTLSPAMNVILVEPKRHYYACPFSNLVISGDRKAFAQKFDYSGLKKRGIQVLHLRATDVLSDKKQVILEDGVTLNYDKLIVSPGISFKRAAISGYDLIAEKTMPHAWTGGQQSEDLASRLKAMRNGGTVIISVPAAPYRCPPGPYERASLIAHFLKSEKPKSKLIVLDAKDSFSKQPLFEKAWREKYDGILEWRGASQDGRLIGVDGLKGLVHTDFETLHADVANIIPPQKAGVIADVAGLTDASGWCPVNALDFSSRLKSDIHVIGDATIAAPMPKSAFSAATQARICAIQILRSLSDLPLSSTVLSNTCYSFTDPEHAVAITGVYSNKGGVLSSIKGAGGLTPMNASDTEMRAESQAAQDWFQSMTQNAFGSVTV